MHVTLPQIVSRSLNCPNCGAHTPFRDHRGFAVNEECPQCGLKINRGDGFFLGPFVISYTFTVGVFIVLVTLLSICGLIGATTAIALGGACALIVPPLLYRTSWSSWLMCYFYFQPQKLPSNRDLTSDSNEE